MINKLSNIIGFASSHDIKIKILLKTIKNENY